MPAPSYELWYTTDTSVRLLSLDRVPWFEASRVVNGVGHLAMVLPMTFDEQLLKVDRMIQVWRAPSGGRLSLWRAYFLRRWRLETSAGRNQIAIWAYDANHLLTRRIVAHYAAEAEADYTATEADDLMKYIVDDAITDGSNPAPTLGGRDSWSLTVQGNLTAGPAIDLGCAWKPLLTLSGGGVLPGIAQTSREQGNEVFFDIVPSSVSSTSIAFEFRTYTNQPGMDVSDRVTFSDEDETLRDGFIEYDYEEEVNYMYAGGQGEEDERTIAQVYDEARINASAWNRCEGFTDARDQDSSAKVADVGDAALEDGKPITRAGGIPVDTAGTAFGLHWNHGDKVRMKYRRREFDCIVRSTVLRMDDQGRETIEARLDYES